MIAPKPLVYTVLRGLQGVLGLTVAGLYGIDLQHTTTSGEHADSRWVYAEVTAGMSILTVSLNVFYVCVFKPRMGRIHVASPFLWPVWEAILCILWLTLFGIFGKMYVKTDEEGQPGIIRMKKAVWVDLTNLCLWCITATWSGIRFFRSGPYDSEFGSGHNTLDQHVEFGEPGSAIDRLEELDSSDRFYQKLKTQFDNEWRHNRQGQDPRLKSIYFDRKYIHVSNTVPSGWRLLYHGTKRNCHLGDSNRPLKVCNSNGCCLCAILREGFKLNCAGSSSTKPMFGRGIYTTGVSSKADLHAKNRYSQRSKAILLCLVYVGTSEKLSSADHKKMAPSPGYNSVEAVTKKEGGAVEYPETVVYSEDAIIPIALIMYKQ